MSVQFDCQSLPLEALVALMTACGNVRRIDMDAKIILFDDEKAAALAVGLFDQKNILGRRVSFSFADADTANIHEKAELPWKYDFPWHFSPKEEQPVPEQSEQNTFNVFVGDLDVEVDENQLAEVFSEFASFQGARVMWDTVTGRSKSYGFVSFSNHIDAERAISSKNKAILCGRAIRCSWAETKNERALPQINSSVYVGNLAENVDIDRLIGEFKAFGAVEGVKPLAGFCFIAYKTPEEALGAIKAMNGKRFENRVLKCGFGKAA